MGRYCTSGNPDYSVFSRFLTEHSPIINADIAMNGVDSSKMYHSMNPKAISTKQIPHGFLFDNPEPIRSTYYKPSNSNYKNVKHCQS